MKVHEKTFASLSHFPQLLHLHYERLKGQVQAARHKTIRDLDQYYAYIDKVCRLSTEYDQQLQRLSSEFSGKQSDPQDAFSRCSSFIS